MNECLCKEKLLKNETNIDKYDVWNLCVTRSMYLRLMMQSMLTNFA